MRWPTFSSRERRAVAFGALVLGPALLIRGGILPYLAAVDEAERQLSGERLLLERELAILAQAAEYPQAFEAVAAQLLTATSRLLPGETPAAAQRGLIRLLERAAARGPALLTRVAPLPARPAGPGLIRISARADGESDLEGLLTVIALIETGAVLLQIDEIRIAARETGTAAAQGLVPAPHEVLAFGFTVTGIALADEVGGGRVDTAGAGASAASGTSARPGEAARGSVGRTP